MAGGGPRCVKCGSPLKEGAMFCTQCGSDVVRQNRGDFVRFLVWALAGIAVTLIVSMLITYLLT